MIGSGVAEFGAQFRERIIGETGRGFFRSVGGNNLRVVKKRLRFRSAGIVAILAGTLRRRNAVCWLIRVLRAFVPWQRAEHHVDTPADQFGFGIRVAVEHQCLNEFFHHLETDFLMRHFAAAETQGQFNLHLIAQKIDRVGEFDAKIVRINLRAELDFFDLVGVVMFFRLFFLFRLFVTIFAVVHEAADRRGRVGRDLDQVDAVGAGKIDGLAQREHTQLLAVVAHDAYFTGAYFSVYSDERTGETRRTRRERAAQDTLDG